MDTWNNKADETLVALYAKGENQAFNVLLNRYKDKLYTYIYYISIDGSILTCTTCIVYQYFKELTWLPPRLLSLRKRMQR